MTRVALLGALLWLLAIGCGEPSSPSFARYNLDGGRYFVEIKDSGGGTSLSFVSTGEGTNVVEERYDLSWGGGSHRLLIENGNLKVDEVERGRLQHGDRILIEKSGEVVVNGARR
ncbi:MAG: hypothetical protein AB9869_30470 [Verrucomicrobiia bacterium]